jgi:Glycosyltransferases involved in cell wall biogenesis
MKISLVVPVFNEEEAIPLFYQSVRKFNPFEHIDVEIVFVNDGSSDTTEK